MPNKNSVSIGISSHHDLYSEVAQMTHGHIGFGCYAALHHNEDGDLADAGDKNTELGDDEYIFGADLDWEGFPVNVEPDHHSGNPQGSKAIFYGDHPVFDYLLNRAPAKNRCCMRSEVLIIRCHRGAKRLQAEDRKHQQFFGCIRIR